MGLQRAGHDWATELNWRSSFIYSYYKTLTIFSVLYNRSPWPVLRAPLVAQMVTSLPAAQETRVRSLGQDLLEKGMATPSSVLAWRIPWTEEPDGLQSMGLQRVGHNWVTNTLCGFILYTHWLESPILHSYIAPPPLSAGNHQSVLYICESDSFY